MMIGSYETKTKCKRFRIHLKGKVIDLSENQFSELWDGLEIRVKQGYRIKAVDL